MVLGNLCVGNKFGTGNLESSTGTQLSNSMTGKLDFCCEGVTSARSSKQPDTFVCIKG
mgnify:CR=1 FL=1